MYRIFHDYLYAQKPASTDPEGRIRLDDWEMREDVQREVLQHWSDVNSGCLDSLSDIEGFHKEFLRHQGFGMDGVDYDRDVEV